MVANQSRQSSPTAEAAAQTAARAEQKLAECQQMAQEYGEQATDAIKENPMTSILIGFGVGLGVGVLVGGMLSGAAPSHRRGYNLRMAEDLGKQMLDSICDYLPDMLTKRFQ